MKKTISENLKIYILTGIAIFLSLTLIIGIITSGKYDMKKSKNSLLFKNLDTNNIEEIILKNESGQEVILAKESGIWTVMYEDVERLADQNRVKSFLTRLKNLEIQSLASSNTSTFSKYGINEQSSNIQLLDKRGMSTSINFGEVIDSNQFVFAQLEAGKKLYKIDNIKATINQENKYWADLKILRDLKNSNEIVAISLKGDNPVSTEAKYSEGNFNYQIYNTVENESLVWKLANSEEELSENEISSLLSSIIGLSAYDYAPLGYELANVKAELSIELASGIKFVLEIGDEDADKSQYYVKLSNSLTVYKVSKWHIEKIILPIEEFFQ